MEEVVKLINKQLQADLPVNISTPVLQEKLSSIINNLIQNDFQRLIRVLYTVDVDENKLKKVLKENADKEAGVIIAELIIQRQTQKIKTRKEFREK